MVPPKNVGDLYKMEQTFEDYGIIIIIYIRNNIVVIFALMSVHNKLLTKKNSVLISKANRNIRTKENYLH
jgi:hypothetical protein